MKQNARFERNILVILSFVLVSAFFISINMYDAIEQGTDSGALAVFADKARSFVYENDAVAAFLGIEEPEIQIDAIPDKDIEAEAGAYIERYNKIYASIY